MREGRGEEGRGEGLAVQNTSYRVVGVIGNLEDAQAEGFAHLLGGQSDAVGPAPAPKPTKQAVLARFRRFLSDYDQYRGLVDAIRIGELGVGLGVGGQVHKHAVRWQATQPPQAAPLNIPPAP